MRSGRSGNGKRGPGRPRAFTRDQARELRREYGGGTSFTTLSSKYGKCVPTIVKAVNGTGAYENTL